MNKRAEQLSQIQTEEFDIVIVGGGITGAGILLNASKHGWKALLIDKNDFASGTSSRSAKMIHGGLRYLEQFQIGLVKEALYERQHLLNEYPHLVRPQPYFMPIYHSNFKKIKIGIGLSLYDKLSGKSNIPKHKSLNKKTIAQKYPQIKTNDIVGGFLYYDAKTNDARLVNEVIQNAVILGAKAINYLACTQFNKADNTVQEIICKDKISNTEIKIKSKVYIIATGVWTDDILKQFDQTDSKKYMAPSKGIHIVVSAEHLPKDDVLIVPTANGDGRFLWCMPWEDNLNIIGTTDTDFKDNLDEIATKEDEIKYILDSVNAQLKDNMVTKKDILSVFAGVRPLLYDNDEAKKSNKRSRDYQIWWNNNNMLTISGGKFTSFLSMANHCLDTVVEKYNFTNSKKNITANIASEIKISDETINLFKERYGIENAKLIAGFIIERQDESLAKKHKIYPYSIAEFLFFIHYQAALKLDDLLTRRTLITYQMQYFDNEYIHDIANIMAKELAWNDTQIIQEIADYRNAWHLMHTWQ